MVLSRNQVKPPVLPKETVDVPELGGEVIVRGLHLTERLGLFVEPGPAPAVEGDAPATVSAEDAAAAAEALLYAPAPVEPPRFLHIPRLLAMAVLASDMLPLYTQQQWEEFGAVHFEASLNLFRVASRLSGLDVEEQKKN